MKKITLLLICILVLIGLGLSDLKRQNDQLEGEQTDTKVIPVDADVRKDRMIRVLLKNNDFKAEYHDSVTISSEKGYTISDGTKSWQVNPWEEKKFDADSHEFGENGILSLESQNGSFCLPELKRDRMACDYEGKLELRKMPEGILVINILPLEAYLRGVVPSEMPASYPEEALKAQAVCARTYALKQVKEGRAKDFFADVDDSVSYQVYNNQDEAESTDLAVKETDGMVLLREEGLEDALYYSTSCGLDVKMDLSSETVFAAFISEDQIRAYEAGEAWYRWKTSISLKCWENVTALKVQDREQDGRARCLEVTDDTGQVEQIEGEYDIRKFLSEGMGTIYLQDGEEMSDMNLLPSAYFILEPEYENDSLTGYLVKGGGYGHGRGMSQNGAKHMALEEMDYKEILKHYYPDADVKDMSDYLAENAQTW